MPVLTEDDCSEGMKKSDSNFIRIQNLPWTACRTDIRQFFIGLSIRDDGILVRNLEAFVLFENRTDAVLALYRRNILLHGTKLELSVISIYELRKILCRIVCRKLDFEHSIKTDIAKFNFQAQRRRRIRPTPVSKGDHRHFVLNSAFLPEETDFSPSRHVNESSSVSRSRSAKRYVSGVRKVYPTRVDDTVDMETLDVFHPKVCYEAKKMRVEV